MVDSISGAGGSSIVDSQGNLSQDVVEGNFDNIIGPNSSLGPDALALLKAQQQMSLDMQTFEIASKAVEQRDKAASTAINNIH